MSYFSKRKLLRITTAILMGVLVVSLTDCDDGDDSRPVAVATTQPGSASVHGVVKFKGPKPMAAVIGSGLGRNSPPVLDESVVVNENGTLRNVVVSIQKAPKLTASPATMPSLDQQNCRYTPHVIAVQTGQAINVSNSDSTLHNVHVQCSENPPDNFSQTKAGESKPVTFNHPEIVQMKCDVHPWMCAYVAVFDHPFFAVTQADGSFSIPHLPPGSYSIVAWQERFGTIERTFTVTENQSAEVNFEYAPPQ